MGSKGYDIEIRPVQRKAYCGKSTERLPFLIPTITGIDSERAWKLRQRAFLAGCSKDHIIESCEVSNSEERTKQMEKDLAERMEKWGKQRKEHSRQRRTCRKRTDVDKLMESPL